MTAGPHEPAAGRGATANRPRRRPNAAWVPGPLASAEGGVDAKSIGSGVVVAGGIAVVLGFVWTMLVGSYAQFAAFLIAVLLVLVTLPLARHAAKVDGPFMARIVMGGIVLKLCGAIARYLVAYGLYGGVADASTYTTVAQNNYHAFRHLHLFAPGTGVFNGLVPFLDTIIYAVAGPTQLGAFFVFSWLSLLGTYLFYRAFRIAYPAGDGRRYAMLIVFLPSLLYWPSSLGKEGWMVMALGLASYGLARVLSQRPGGYASLLAGVGAMLLVRPHLALIFLPAAMLALLLRFTSTRKISPVRTLVGLVVLVGVSLVVVAKAESYFGITSLDPTTVTAQLNTTREQTDVGNSAFNPPNAQSPVGFPKAVLTVLYRPFPWEAHSAAVLVASGEGVVLMILTAVSWRRLRRLASVLWRNPYVVFSLVYSALFVVAFSNFSNFGILARERVQMFPMLLVLLAIPASAPLGTEWDAAAVGGDERWAATTRRSPDVGVRRAPIRPRLEVPAGRSPSRPAAPARRGVRGRRAGPFHALEFRFDVEVGPGVDLGLLARALVDMAGPGPADHHLRILSAGDPQYVVGELDGEPCWGPVAMPELMDGLIAECNSRAAASRPDQLALHAAALSWGDVGLLLPGPPGAGKSTLAAALVARGFDYLTDEVAAIDRQTCRIAAYPKPLSLWPESPAFRGMPGWESQPADGERRLFVPATGLRAGSLAEGATADLLVFPHHGERAAADLVLVNRAEAIVAVANNSFNFVDHGAAWLPSVRLLVLRCTCWRLTMGDLDSACQLLVDLAQRRASLPQ